MNLSEFNMIFFQLTTKKVKIRVKKLLQSKKKVLITRKNFFTE